MTLKYEYYWRLDPHVKFPCPITFDPFLAFRSGIRYGFTIAMKDDLNTFPTLWRKIKSFYNLTSRKEFREKMPGQNALDFITVDEKLSLDSLCTFWNNFEIGAFSIYRNSDYLAYFDFLDKAGGFFYERWGDAPVHTYYALLNLKKEEIRRFKNVGYGHSSRYNWPEDRNILK